MQKKKDGGTRYKGHRKDGRRGKGMHSFDIKTKIYYGDGALDRLTQIPYKKVMIITDPFVVQSGMVMMITSRLDEAKIEFEVFKDVVPDPPIDKVVAGVKAVMDYKPEAIVAVGGGSAIDSAKAIREFASRVGGLDNIALICLFRIFFISCEEILDAYCTAYTASDDYTDSVCIFIIYLYF